MFAPGKRLPPVLRLQHLASITAIIIGTFVGCVSADATSLGAPYSFGEQLTHGEGVLGLVSADLDGDGKPELIGSEPEANRIVVWEPDGAGGLRIKSAIPCQLPGALVAADFNSDGIMDIATVSPTYCGARCNPDSNRLTLLTGLGGGAFRTAQTLIMHATWQLSSGDFNGDGRPDLVTYEDSLSIIFNNGTGFESPVRYALTLEPYNWIAGLTMGDVNRDGFADIVVVLGDKTLIYSGNSQGALIAPDSLAFGMWDGSNPILADFDSDGALDLVLPENGGSFAVFWNSGTGLFPEPQHVPCNSEFTNRMAAADLDGDGRLDLFAAASHGYKDRIVIEWNMGARNWEQVHIFIADEALPHGISALLAYDFDRDGLLDVVDVPVIDVGGDVLGFRHVAARSFAALEEYSFDGPVGGVPITLEDGRSAILILGNGAAKVMIARPDGSFAPPIDYAGTDGASWLDWNEDGLVDFGLPRGDSLEIHLLGGGQETVPKLPSGTIIGRGDFNGDGLKDVLLRTPGLDLRIAFRDPLHGYSDPIPLPAGSDFPQPAIVAVGDFNGDGLCDFSTGQRDSGNVTNSVIVYLNSAGGRFIRGLAQAVPAMPAGYDLPGPSQLLAKDLDGDHRLDIVFCGTFWAAGGLVWIGRGLGDGSFEWTPDRYGLPSEAPSCSVIDLTNDGLPDMVGMSYWNGTGIGKLSFLANLGGGRFGEPGLLQEIGAYPSGPSFADLNGDGRTDIVTNSWGYYPYEHGNVRILLNIGQDIATPVSLAPLRAVLQGTQARIEWFSQDRGSISGTVMRSDDGGGWHSVGTAWCDGTGLVGFTDASIHTGTRYSYRLDYLVGGIPQHTATIELYVPAAALALAFTNGNPAHGRLRVSCVLPNAEPARLDIFDIAGRRVESSPVTRLPSGVAIASLNGDSQLGAGIYWARLTQGSHSVGTRIVLLP